MGQLRKSLRGPFSASCSLPRSCPLAQEWNHFCGGEAHGTFHCFLPGEGLRGGQSYTITHWATGCHRNLRLVYSLPYLRHCCVIEVVGPYDVSPNGIFALRLHTEF